MEQDLVAPRKPVPHRPPRLDRRWGVVLPGGTIGTGAVVGAGAMVKDVPPDTIVVGNPDDLSRDASPRRSPSGCEQPRLVGLGPRPPAKAPPRLPRAADRRRFLEPSPCLNPARRETPWRATPDLVLPTKATSSGHSPVINRRLEEAYPAAPTPHGWMFMLSVQDLTRQYGGRSTVDGVAATSRAADGRYDRPIGRR